ncbi:prepilin peptidase [Xylanimonas ulmi]|uniref:prepilin peptidase n=1 Tax=Xylanimonas ulmi TaxID=228973 RepID=UPI0013EE4789|nr:prepilin peptidase [Xylanibacterium ulmi]
MDDGTTAVGRGVRATSAGRFVRAGGLPLVVMAATVLAVASTRGDGWLVVTLVLIAPPLVAITIIDARRHRVPNHLTLAVLAATVVTVAGRAFTEPGVTVRAAVASVVVGLFYLLLWRFADLGLGDVKLAAALALVAGWSGWQTVVVFVVVAHLLQVPVAVWRLARRRRDRIAFAPGLVIGLYLAVAVGSGLP